MSIQSASRSNSFRAKARSDSARRSVTMVLGLALSLLTMQRGAWANGAFPAPFRIFVPANRPNDITVTANFGLITTRDGGQTWLWTCEHGDSSSGYLYQQAEQGSGRILGLASGAVVYTDNDACGWSRATGFPAGTSVDDSFIDPADPQHVLAIAHSGTGTSALFGLYVSTNGGTSFNAQPTFSGAPGTRLDSVEIAKTNANRLYLTSSPWNADGSAPRVLRSDDGGHAFTMLDASTELQSGTLRIAAIDGANPDKIYLRYSGSQDRLMISTDAGRTLKTALLVDVGRELSAFLRRGDGVLFAATMDSFDGTLFRSMDAGVSFQALPMSLRVGSIVERAGTLYALGDGINDPFLVGTSKDNGNTFTPFLVFHDVKGVQRCGTDLRAECKTSCQNLSDGDIFAPEICMTLAGPEVADAGASPDAAQKDAGGSMPPAPKSGCGSCAIGGDATKAHERGEVALCTTLCMAAVLHRRRRRAVRK